MHGQSLAETGDSFASGEGAKETTDRDESKRLFFFFPTMKLPFLPFEFYTGYIFYLFYISKIRLTNLKKKKYNN